MTATICMTEETRLDEAVWQTQLATTILIVDDSPMDRRIAGSVVEKHPGWRAVYATDGREALPLLQSERPDLILTDMLMPQMNGLELLQAARNFNPDISVVLMTASGSEELANHALRHGAASYVPKTNLARDLATTLEQVLAAGQGIRKAQLLPSLARSETDFVLENDPALVRAHVLHMQEDLARLNLFARMRVRIGMALSEAMINGMVHGNLELGPDAKKQGERAFQQLTSERRAQLPYRDRRLFVKFKLFRTEAVFVVRDEGPGFDHGRLAGPKDITSLSQPCGRGFTLMRSFMDDVSFNECGNEITLVKRNEP
jgi:CheY-like chemotaxis protein/anti-sigma regulatory factor (Ser/Thr protein kinase)